MLWWSFAVEVITVVGLQAEVYERELKAERSGIPYSEYVQMQQAEQKTSRKRKRREQKGDDGSEDEGSTSSSEEQEAAPARKDDDAMDTVMMSRKHRRLYNRIQYSKEVRLRCYSGLGCGLSAPSFRRSERLWRTWRRRRRNLRSESKRSSAFPRDKTRRKIYIIITLSSALLIVLRTPPPKLLHWRWLELLSLLLLRGHLRRKARLLHGLHWWLHGTLLSAKVSLPRRRLSAKVALLGWRLHSVVSQPRTHLTRRLTAIPTATVATSITVTVTATVIAPSRASVTVGTATTTTTPSIAPVSASISIPASTISSSVASVTAAVTSSVAPSVAGVASISLATRPRPTLTAHSGRRHGGDLRRSSKTRLDLWVDGFHFAQARERHILKVK